jgi:hypothetical protein
MAREMEKEVNALLVNNFVTSLLVLVLFVFLRCVQGDKVDVLSTGCHDVFRVPFFPSSCNSSAPINCTRVFVQCINAHTCMCMRVRGGGWRVRMGTTGGERHCCGRYQKLQRGVREGQRGGQERTVLFFVTLSNPYIS